VVGGAFDGSQATQCHAVPDVALLLPAIHKIGDWEVGGRLQHFSAKWQSIMAGPWVIQVVSEGYKIEFTEKPSFGGPRVTPIPSDPDKRASLLGEINKLLTKEAISPVFPPFSQGFWSTFFLTSKKNGEWRPILNLKPLNIFISPQKFRMESLSVILKAPIRGSWAVSIDLKDAYLHVPIRREDRRWLRFSIGDQTFEFKCLPFGLSTAPRVFTRVVQEVGAFLRRKGIQIFMYLDDWLILAQSAEAVTQSLNRVIDEVTSLGFIINLEKSNLTPSQEPIFLGARLDLVKGLAFPSSERLENLVLSCQSLETRNSAPASEWLRVLGFMASMVDLIPFCRLHMRIIQLNLLKTFNMSLHPMSRPVPVHWEVKRELRWWSCLHNVSVGVPFPSPPHQMTLTTDASLKGWGGFIENHTAKGLWSPQEMVYHINSLELWAVRNSLRELELLVLGKKILVRSDNSTVVAYINKQGGTKSESLCRETRSLLIWCIERNIVLTASFIPGVENLKADSLSRGASLFVGNWALSRSIFTELSLLRDFPSIDLFASRINNQLPVFCSRRWDPLAWETDALSFSWEGLAGYAFPPICLISRILQKIQAEECLILLIAPLWPRRHWFQQLLSLSVMDPIALPQSRDLLRLPKSKARFHNVEYLQLTAWTLSSNDSRRRDYLRNLQVLQPGVAEHQLSEYTLRVPDSSSNGVMRERLIHLQLM
jgi:hypothetical protein